MGKRSSQGLAFLIEERPVEAFEQLNVAARVVPLHNWFFLAAAFLTLGAFGAFSFWYQVPLKVEGRGILLAEADPGFRIPAPGDGAGVGAAGEGRGDDRVERPGGRRAGRDRPEGAGRRGGFRHGRPGAAPGRRRADEPARRGGDPVADRGPDAARAALCGEAWSSIGRDSPATGGLSPATRA